MLCKFCLRAWELYLIPISCSLSFPSLTLCCRGWRRARVRRTRRSWCRSQAYIHWMPSCCPSKPWGCRYRAAAGCAGSSPGRAGAVQTSLQPEGLGMELSQEGRLCQPCPVCSVGIPELWGSLGSLSLSSSCCSPSEPCCHPAGPALGKIPLCTLGRGCCPLQFFPELCWALSLGREEPWALQLLSSLPSPPCGHSRRAGEHRAATAGAACSNSEIPSWAVVAQVNHPSLHSLLNSSSDFIFSCLVLRVPLCSQL